MALLATAVLLLHLGASVLGQPRPKLPTGQASGGVPFTFGSAINLGTQWEKITDNFATIPKDALDQFRPLNEWSLEIKTLDEVPAEDFEFEHGDKGSETTTHKEDFVTILFNDGPQLEGGAPILNLQWSRKGFEVTDIPSGAVDVTSRYCVDEYRAFYSGPNVCNRASEQVWRFDFNQNAAGTDVKLFCQDKLEFERSESVNDCFFVGKTVNEIDLLHLRNNYIRMVPRPPPVVPNPPTTDAATTDAATTHQYPSPTTAQPTTEQVTTEDLPGETDTDEPTCDCWTAECSYCEDPKCRVDFDLTGAGSGYGITITSRITYKTVNTIMLFNGNGDVLGAFQFNRKGIYLTGCVGCKTPRPFPISIAGAQVYTWNLAFQGATLTLTVNGNAIFVHELTGECAAIYSDIKEFAFTDIGCTGTFMVTPGMYPGDLWSPAADTCGQECPELLL